MKQTAVEWLEKEIKNEDHHTEGELGNSCIDVNTLLMLLKQAKEMEKEQIIESYCQGCFDINKDESIFPRETSEDYYKETFKSE